MLASVERLLDNIKNAMSQCMLKPLSNVKERMSSITKKQAQTMIKKTLSFATAAVIIAFFLGCASTDVINQPEAKPPKEKLISSEILNADGRVKERTFKNKNGEMVKAEMFSYYDTGELQ
jgi:hypothetical protein